jgi:hypothetical protein
MALQHGAIRAGEKVVDVSADYEAIRREGQDEQRRLFVKTGFACADPGFCAVLE